ncbi:acyl--CoA ligase [Azospirillum sp. RWY-5-1]|uniref:Acyl--CoA ligase n=1 Tax=Azospirillum oleiclasticum TaxID=2735135 RepID=A0ABX2TME0_9PROT|nr:acyl--CoA ligase [Azospirillum oleiclasticum]NYZ23990.1 acyl--CoA ligase [Azospirillum oleiclasticum]
MNEFVGKTYAQSLELLAERYGPREALVFRDRRFTFRDLKELADRASVRFAALGLRPGDKIALWLPNRPEHIVYWLGASQMGLVTVMLNTRLKQPEMAYQLAQSDSRAVLVPGPDGHRDFLADLGALCPWLSDRTAGTSESLPELRHVLCCDPPGDGYPGATDWSAPLPEGLLVPPMETDPDRPALIAYSSGTTALPKGAMITHCLWRKGWDIGIPIDLGPDDCLYMSIPLFGSMATMNGVNQFWVRGGRVVLGEQFEPRDFLDTVQRERCTAAHLLPPMIHQICALPDLDRYDLSSLRIAFVLSADRGVLDLVATRMGVPGVMTGYGMTETTTVVSRNRWDDPQEARFTTQGRPMPGVELRVVDPVSYETLPAGQSGEIWVRGYCVMAGYYKKPEETARVMHGDGWFRTGDLGAFTEDGRLVFKGRLGDGYKTRGFNVSPSEIEMALARHPAVAETAVVGIPDSDQGDIGIAYVIRSEGADADEAELVAFLRTQLASYKIPRHVFFVDELPLTAGTGKVQKFRLREDARRRLGRDPAGPDVGSSL